MRSKNASANLIATVIGEDFMKSFLSFLTAVSLAAGTSSAFAQPAAATAGASAVSSYSPPVSNHVKKPKTSRAKKRWFHKVAPSQAASE